MRTIVIVCLSVALAGCSSYIERLKAQEKAAEDATKAADDVKCREFGFKPGTDGYGNCRLQLEQMRVAKSGGVASDPTTPAPTSLPPLQGQQGLSLLCKDALARGDRAAGFVHC
jgi:uncharacterized protein YceK